jgi:hypothetical protein
MISCTTFQLSYLRSVEFQNNSYFFSLTFVHGIEPCDLVLQAFRGDLHNAAPERLFCTWLTLKAFEMDEHSTSTYEV